METNIAFLCFDISRLFRKKFAEAAKEIGGTGPQLRSLLILQRKPGINQGALAEYLEVEPITACRMIDRLEQAGLVERRRAPDDRRAWQLFLTPDADPVVIRLKEIARQILDEVTSCLNEEELGALEQNLLKVRDHIVALNDDYKPAETCNG